MGATRKQIDRIYSIKMNAILNKKAQREKEQDEADRNAFMKAQEDRDKLSLKLSLLGMYKDLKDSYDMGLATEDYEGDITAAGRPLKYERKDPRSFGEVIAQPKETAKRLLPGGMYEETEGYKEFQVKEAAKELDRARATVPIAEETEFDVIGQDYVPPGTPEVPLAEETEFDVSEEYDIEEPGLTRVGEDWAEAPPTYDSYALSKMLDESGIRLPEGMSQENKDAIMTALDKVVEEGNAQDYKAFTDTLKKGLDNPGMFEAVVTDLTENTDVTLDRIQEGTYTPGQEPLYREDIPEAPVVEEVGIPEGIEEPFQEKYYGGVDPSTDTLPLTKPEYAPEQIQEIQRQADLSSEMQKETAGGIGAMNWRDIRETSEKAPEVSEDDPMFQFMQEGWEAGADQAGQEAAPMLASAGPLSDAPLDVSTDVTDVPDAKPDGKFVGKALGALKTLQTMQGIGQTLTDEEASGADKAIAGTQGVKMLADLAAKRAGQKTAGQIGSKAATQYLKGKGLQEGVKLGGKAAVGAAAGGVIGGYTMVAEAGEAKESWEEGDYDEAILHGISSVSGGLQTAGAGMMLSGVGAPLGAVLYGVGTAASVISSGAQLLEGLFGGSDAPALLEVKKQKFNAGRYLQSIRDNRSTHIRR